MRLRHEYDAVLSWGDYVFVFECKNQALSGGSPVQAFHFAQDLASYRKQVARLADALRRYPDILAERMGVDVAGKTIVPCVLYALPYAYPGAVDGVYLFDASALKRFFDEQHFRLVTPHQITENVRLFHRVAMHSAWTGDEPTPEDLVGQLENPFQIALAAAHTQLAFRPFPVGVKHVVSPGELYRMESTLESYAELTGVSATAIRREQAEVLRQVRKLKARLELRERPWNRRKKKR